MQTHNTLTQSRMPAAELGAWGFDTSPAVRGIRNPTVRDRDAASQLVGSELPHCL